MFTGIVQGMGRVVAIEDRSEFRRYTLAFPAALVADLETGASVANNGCCLTVTAITGNQVSFDLMRETLMTTNLGDSRQGDLINLERAARFGDEIGGHAMSGHIFCTAPMVAREDSTDNCEIWCEVPPEAARYLFARGYIGIDGISLTLAEVRDRRFRVNLIPETLARTNLGIRRPGDRVNIEVDPQTQAIVATVERVLAQRHSRLSGADQG